MTTVILFVFGTVIGSFLNVVGLRWNSGLTLEGRSHCQSCSRKLSWWELVPILSFLSSLGHCRQCGARISWQYPLIEMVTGLVFVTIYQLALALLPTLILGLVACLFVVIVIYDLRHKIIPDELVYASIFLSFIFRLLVGGTTLDFLAGPILFAIFGGIWWVSRGRAMGFGDAKLVLSIGLLLGAANGFSGIVVAFWIGAIYGIGLIIFGHLKPLLSVGKRITMKSELPFAPFIILGAWLGLIFDLDLLHVSFF